MIPGKGRPKSILVAKHFVVADRGASVLVVPRANTDVICHCDLGRLFLKFDLPGFGEALCIALSRGLGAKGCGAAREATWATGKFRRAAGQQNPSGRAEFTADSG